MAAPSPSPPAMPTPQAPTQQQQPSQQALQLPPEIEDALARQVEWYLGRTNLERDFFLKQRMDPEFWVNLEVILAFPKMRQHGVSDPAVVANVLARLSTDIDVDTARNRVRPAWAKRSFLALTSVPQGTPVAAVDGLFAKTPGTPRPISVTPFPEKEGMWHVVFENPDDARIALDMVKDLTIGSATPPVKVTAHVFPAFDQSAFAPGSFGPPSTLSAPLSPGGSGIAGGYYDGAAANVNVASMTSAYVAAGMPPGMMAPPMNTMGMTPHGGPNAGSYGYAPGGVYPAGVNSTYSPATGYIPGNQRGYAGGGQPYYLNAYGAQGQYDPSMVPQQPNGSNAGGGGQGPTAEMQERQAAAAAAARAAAAGQAAGNVNVGGVGSKASSGSDANGPHSGGTRARRQSQRQGNHFHQNGGPGVGANQGRFQGAQGADATRGNVQQQQARISTGSGSVDFPSSAATGNRGNSQTQQPGNGTSRKPGTTGNGGLVGPSGDGNRTPKGQAGAAGDGPGTRPNSVGKKNKKRANVNRQSTGSNSGGTGPDGKSASDPGDGGKDDGKKGMADNSLKSGADKVTRLEPNLTTMYFPPLPGSNEGTGTAKPGPRGPTKPLGSSQGSIAAVVAGGSPKSPVSAAGAPSSGTESDSRDAQKKNASQNVPPVEQQVDAPVAAGLSQAAEPAASLTDASTGKEDPSAAAEIDTSVPVEKTTAVSDVASTVSSSSGGAGNGTSPGGVSLASAASGDEKLSSDGSAQAAIGPGMSYAAILRAKAKKPPPPPVSASPGASDSADTSSASGNADPASAPPSNAGNDSPSGVKQPTSKSGLTKKTNQKNNGKGSGSGASDGSSRASSATHGASEAGATKAQVVTPPASAPRSVWANKPQSVLQPTAVVKPQPAKPATAASIGTVPSASPSTSPRATKAASDKTARSVQAGVDVAGSKADSNGSTAPAAQTGPTSLGSVENGSGSTTYGGSSSPTASCTSTMSKPQGAVKGIPDAGGSAISSVTEGSTVKSVAMNGGGISSAAPKGAWGQGPAAKILSKKDVPPPEKGFSKATVDP